ncbi:37106_t:CDS:2 [Racocetra persica]|uniref:37106_t:CDS:1 n=1 Tax=Racocetra persica TaxID=160502 RepID=A0ACA9QTN1_9GLOM|nr:37106_t:CDS:2 [Racocetra persica]
MLESLTEFSNTCACCYKQKKRCKRKGEYRCEICKKRQTECLVQCIKCYKQNKENKDQFPQCAHCKFHYLLDPPIEYNFIEEDGKVYLDFGDGLKF